MNKLFLLIAGDNYSPGAGAEDWIGFYASEEEINSMITPVNNDVLYHSGKDKGKVAFTKKTYEIMINDDFVKIVDWYEIVDVRNWTHWTKKNLDNKPI